MLTLGRREGERICIGDDIVVKVIRIEGVYVRIGIEAPPCVSIDRAEIRARKLKEAQHGEGKKAS